MISKTDSRKAFSRNVGRSTALALTVLLAISACTTEDDPVSGIEAATEEVASVATAPDSEAEESDEAQVSEEASQEEEADTATSNDGDSDEETSNTVASNDDDSNDDGDSNDNGDSNDDGGSDDSADTTSSENPPDNANRLCFAQGSDVAILDLIGRDSPPFTGVVAIGDSVAAISGNHLDRIGATTTEYEVNVSMLGAAEDGTDTIERQLWFGDTQAMTIAGVTFSEADCGELAEQISRLVPLVGDSHPPVPGSVDDVGTVRSCYLHADEVLFLDLDQSTMTFTGAYTLLGSTNIFAGRAGERLQGGEDELLVNNITAADQANGQAPTVQRWLKSDVRAEMLVEDWMFAEVASCSSLPEVAEIDGISVYPDLP